MLLIRADANVSMGTGHIMRCLALAQAWRNQIGPVTFVCSEIPDRLADRLKSESFDVIKIDVVPGSNEDFMHLLEISRVKNTKRVVVDGYQFNDAYQQGLTGNTCRVLFFDDYGHCSRYEADWILNQNLNADATLYDNRSPRTKLLLGSDYILLRQEFLDADHTSKIRHTSNNNILVTLGGSDPQNLTLKSLLALRQFVTDSMAVQVILGAGYPYRSTLEDIIRDFPSSIETIENVSDMAPVFEWTDFAICGGGSTNWEMAYFGIPRIVLIQADNQLLACQSLERASCAFTIDARATLDQTALVNQLHQLTLSPKRMQQMSEANREIVDGDGINRLLKTIAPDHAGIRNERGIK